MRKPFDAYLDPRCPHKERSLNQVLWNEKRGLSPCNCLSFMAWEAFLVQHARAISYIPNWGRFFLPLSKSFVNSSSARRLCSLWSSTAAKSFSRLMEWTGFRVYPSPELVELSLPLTTRKCLSLSLHGSLHFLSFQSSAPFSRPSDLSRAILYPYSSINQVREDQNSNQINPVWEEVR